ncbi:MAG: hypothetical protein RR303_10955, partial [Bacteroidales bacterium]
MRKQHSKVFLMLEAFRHFFSDTWKQLCGPFCFMMVYFLFGGAGNVFADNMKASMISFNTDNIQSGYVEVAVPI